MNREERENLLNLLFSEIDKTMKKRKINYKKLAEKTGLKYQNIYYPIVDKRDMRLTNFATLLNGLNLELKVVKCKKQTV